MGERGEVVVGQVELDQGGEFVEGVAFDQGDLGAHDPEFAEGAEAPKGPRLEAGEMIAG